MPTALDFAQYSVSRKKGKFNCPAENHMLQSENDEWKIEENGPMWHEANLQSGITDPFIPTHETKRSERAAIPHIPSPHTQKGMHNIHIVSLTKMKVSKARLLPPVFKGKYQKKKKRPHPRPAWFTLEHGGTCSGWNFKELSENDLSNLGCS